MCFSFRTLAAVCSVAVSLNTGCTARNDIQSSDSTGSSPLFEVEENAADRFITPDTPAPECFDAPDSIDCTITFADDSIGIRGDGAEVSGSDAVITEGGVYRLSGECGKGRVIVRSDEEVSLVLEGLVLHNESGAAIENTGDGSLVVTLADNTHNSLVCEGGDTVGIHSTSDITINGGGELHIDVGGKSALNSLGAVKLCGGRLYLISDGDGIVSSSHIIAAGSDTTINSGADGLKVTYTGSDGLGYVNVTGGTLDIVSATDGIQAENAVFISGGSLSLNSGGGGSAVMFSELGGRYLRGRHGGYTAGGDKDFDFSDLVSGDGSIVSSKKGIRSGGFVMINGGEAHISSADDSIYAKSGIFIDSGRLSLNSGDDGLHSDDGIIITGGELSVEGSYNSIEGMMVEIRGGDITLASRRCGIVAAGGTQLASSSATDLSDRYISISGGNVSLNSGGSGMDSGGAATVSGGMLTVYSGDNDLFGSVDHRDYFALSGGVFAAFGSDGATKAPNVLSRPCLSILADIAAGSMVEIMDNAGKLIFSTVVPSASSTMLFSSDEIVSGAEYCIYADDVLHKTVIATEGISGDGPSGRVTGIFDNIGENTSEKQENIA